MDDILGSILGYRTISESKARKIHHLSHTPPEYWTAKERVLSGKLRTEWLREERKCAARGGNPAILERIWPVGPYWPNGGVLAGGERTRREFREEVGRMRYRDQARAESHSNVYNVHPSDLQHLPEHILDRLKSQGDWTRQEPNQILNDQNRARQFSRDNQPWRRVGRSTEPFSSQEIRRNGRFGNMVYAPSERDLYRRHGWDEMGPEGGPVYAPLREGYDSRWGGGNKFDDPGRDGRPSVFEVGNGLGPEWFQDGGRDRLHFDDYAPRGGRPPFY